MRPTVRGTVSNPIYRARGHQYIMAAPGGNVRIVTKPVRVDHTKCSGGGPCLGDR